MENKQFNKMVENLNAEGSSLTEMQSVVMGADGKVKRGIKAVFSGGLSEVRKKVVAKAKAKTASKASASAGSGAGTASEGSSPAESTDQVPNATKPEEKGFNWLLWGGVGVAVIGSIIGVVIWKKNQGKSNKN